jgi:flotillin
MTHLHTSLLAMSTGTMAMVFSVGAVLLIVLVSGLVYAVRFKRCPSNRVLVVFGRVGTDQASRCHHGGGKFVVPLLQDYAYLSLEPLVIEIELMGALSKNNIRVNVPSTFTVGISTKPETMRAAAERLLMLSEQKIKEQAQDIILGQLRLVIATLEIEEINRDREKFLGQIEDNVSTELAKIGLDVINVNIRDITDESGYIVAIGKRAAAEAINRAKVEVAEQERDGATGEAIAQREEAIAVASEQASSETGRKDAEQRQRVAVAQFEATAVSGEAESQRQREVVVAQQKAESLAGQKLAEREQRIRIADAEAEAVKGENEASQQVAQSDAELAEIRAEATRRAEVAAAKSLEQVLIAERERELARLSKEQLAPQEIEQKRIEIEAETEAERQRRIARGEADAILARYNAEAEGTQRVLEAKAEGYLRLVEACATSPQLAPTLLMIEKLPEIVREQVKAIQNLQIDKITVWDSGSGGQAGGKGSTADFLSGLIGSLPQMHELAKQAGVKLPSVLGELDEGSVAAVSEAKTASGGEGAAKG